MSAKDDIPTLTEVIEKRAAEDEIRLADLGLDDDPGLDDGDLEIEDFAFERPADPFSANPALEQAVRRILDEHMELAWQEIKILLKRELNKS